MNVKFRVADPVLVTWMLACAVPPGQAFQRISQTQRGGHSVSGISQQHFRRLGISIFGRVAVISSPAASTKSRVVFADIDLELLRQYRINEVWADAYRKPYAYGALVSSTTREPFRRSDSRRTRPDP